MDAKTFVSLQINRLQDLLSEEVRSNNPTLVKDVVTAIKYLHTFEQSLPVSSDVQKAYLAEDVTDSLFIRKEFQSTRNTLPRRKETQQTRKTENNGFKKKFQWPFRSFKSSHSQDQFALELEKFITEITALSARVDVFGSKNDAGSLEEETDVLRLGIDIRDNPDGDQVPTQERSHSTTQATAAAGGEIQPVVCDRDSSSGSENHSDPPFPVPHVSDHPTNKVIAVVGEAGTIKSTVARPMYNHMPPLNDDKSWELFSMQLDEIPEAVSKYKENILKVCGGLPLRIVCLGSLLLTKDWSSVIETNGNREAIETNENGGAILALLSYQDLSLQVKSCFLYMGLFPKEDDIPVRRLIHLWCAEGFVTSNYKEMVPEDLAELYILVLVIRNMIQVKWRFDGSPKKCRMHHNLYDIFSHRAEDVGFFDHGQLQQSQADVKPLVQRLAARYLDNNNFPSSSLDFRYLGSCLVFDTRGRGEQDTQTPASQICGFLDKIIVNGDFGLLKVLDLEGVYKPTLTDAIVERLLQLSYLGLRSTSINSLPSFVGFLPYLETLDLKHTEIKILPPSIRKAKKLQHFYLNGSHSEIFMNLSSSNLLDNLRTLWGLCIKDDCNGKLNFSRLRKLGLTCHSTSALKIITQLTQLQHLKVNFVGEDGRQSNSTPQTAEQGSQQQWTQLQESAARIRRQIMGKSSGTPDLVLQDMKKLQNLFLEGKLEKQVIDVRFLPPNLRILTLSGSRLEEDPMPVLEQLCYLNILRLFPDSYVGREMKCALNGFPQLRVLNLWKLEQLERWTVEEGAMPCLRELEIRGCNPLLRVPIELERYLTT